MCPTIIVATCSNSALPDQIPMIAAARPAHSIATCVLVFAALVLFLPLIFLYELSWDEFFLLEWVHLWNKGELTLPLQTIYIRAFSWLPHVSDHEVDQLIAARAVMLAGLILTSTFIFATSRRFYSFQASAFAVVAFLTFSLVFRNASSFRADGVVIPILMAVCFRHWFVPCCDH